MKSSQVIKLPVEIANRMNKKYYMYISGCTLLQQLLLLRNRRTRKQKHLIKYSGSTYLVLGRGKVIHLDEKVTSSAKAEHIVDLIDGVSLAISSQ